MNNENPLHSARPPLEIIASSTVRYDLEGAHTLQQRTDKAYDRGTCCCPKIVAAFFLVTGFIAIVASLCLRVGHNRCESVDANPAPEAWMADTWNQSHWEVGCTTRTYLAEPKPHLLGVPMVPGPGFVPPARGFIIITILLKVLTLVINLAKGLYAELGMGSEREEEPYKAVEQCVSKRARKVIKRTVFVLAVVAALVEIVLEYLGFQGLFGGASLYLTCQDNKCITTRDTSKSFEHLKQQGCYVFRSARDAYTTMLDVGYMLPHAQLSHASLLGAGLVIGSLNALIGELYFKDGIKYAKCCARFTLWIFPLFLKLTEYAWMLLASAWSISDGSSGSCVMPYGDESLEDMVQPLYAVIIAVSTPQFLSVLFVAAAAWFASTRCEGEDHSCADCCAKCLSRVACCLAYTLYIVTQVVYIVFVTIGAFITISNMVTLATEHNLMGLASTILTNLTLLLLKGLMQSFEW